MGKTKTKETRIYEIKIMLAETEIWRTFLVKSDIKLSELHLIIQTIMGWSNSHMHQFFDNGIIYGMPDVEDYGLDIVDFGNYNPEYFNIEQINESLKEKDYGCFSIF